MNLRPLSLAASLLCTSLASAQVHEPARGSAERAAVLDALRDAVRSPDGGGIRGAVEFTDVQLRVAGDWAVVDASLRRPGGRSFRPCDDEAGEEVGDDGVLAVLYRRSGRWETWEIAACLSDWPYQNLPAVYGLDPGLHSGFDRPPAVPRNARVGQTDDGFVSLRSVPSASRGERRARMPGGASVRILSCQSRPDRVGDVRGRWCEVRYGTQTGWAFGPYLD